MAVVKGGQVVLLEGYGLRDLDGNLPVTPRTIFPIASITKSFTVATLASLIAEGKLDWDKPVHEVLPGFRLYDDVARLRVTPRDLVTHRTGMKRSGFSIGQAKSDADCARGYKKDDQQEVKAIPYYEQTEMGPAGTLVSTAEDLSRYLLMYLGKGQFEGRQVLAEADVIAMQTPQMVTPAPLLFPEISHTSYGMGLFVTTYRGHKLVQHGGNIDGFSLLLSFLPQDDMGVVYRYVPGLRPAAGPSPRRLERTFPGP